VAFSAFPISGEVRDRAAELAQKRGLPDEAILGTRTDEFLDIQQAAKILDEGHFGLGDVKDRILEFLAVHPLSGGNQKNGRILLFPGPPGCDPRLAHRAHMPAGGIHERTSGAVGPQTTLAELR